jgi:hypothetical protein
MISNRYQQIQLADQKIITKINIIIIEDGSQTIIIIIEGGSQTIIIIIEGGSQTIIIIIEDGSQRLLSPHHLYTNLLNDK